MITTYILILFLLFLGLILIFLGSTEFSRQMGIGLAKAAFYLSLYLAYLATSQHTIFYILVASGIADIFLSIMFFEKKNSIEAQR